MTTETIARTSRTAILTRSVFTPGPPRIDLGGQLVAAIAHGLDQLRVFAAELSPQRLTRTSIDRSKPSPSRPRVRSSN